MAGNTVAKAQSKFIPNVTMENVRIVFRNFAGTGGPMNKEGDRNFAVILEDPAVVEALIDDGWNVKYLKPREDGDEPQPYLPVALKFRAEGERQPNVVMITSRGRTKLGVDEVAILDWAELAMVDLIVRPYKWDVNGKTGVKAYVKSLFVTIREDELEQKYADVPDSTQNLIGGRENPLEITDGNEIVLGDDEVWED